jgi:hypothetical protein
MNEAVLLYKGFIARQATNAKQPHRNEAERPMFNGSVDCKGGMP